MSTELWVCNEGKVQKYYGDVTSYKVGAGFDEPYKQAIYWVAPPFFDAAIDCEQLEVEALGSCICTDCRYYEDGTRIRWPRGKKGAFLMSWHTI